MLARAWSALQVRPGEGRLVAWVVLLMFLPSAGGAIGSPSVEALFYARFGVLATRWLVAVLDTENLLLVWAGTLLVSFLIVRALTRGLRERRVRRRTRLIDDVARGYQFVRRSALMRWIALAALLLSVLSF